MKQRLRRGGSEILKRIGEDISRYKWAAAAFALYDAAVLLLFGEFCPVVIFTGFPCPGCGTTRAFLNLLAGRPDMAFRYNPCVFLWALIGLYLVWNRYVRGKKPKGIFQLLCTAAALAVLCYLYRMFCLFPGEPPLVFSENSMLGRLLPFYNELVGKWIVSG